MIALALIGCGTATVEEPNSPEGGQGADVPERAEPTDRCLPIAPPTNTNIACDGEVSPYPTRVASACFGDGQAFGQDRLDELVAGPPQGRGCCAGSTDVVSLGNGGQITLSFEQNPIVDGPGVDFIVFENAFFVEGDTAHVYAELAQVDVSDDGAHWKSFPCTSVAPPYGSCAGWHPVFAHPSDAAEELDAEAAGGDRYDLADLEIERVRFVRITDRADLPSVFDLDGIAAIHTTCM